jgi:hypothetical protein
MQKLTTRKFHDASSNATFAGLSNKSQIHDRSALGATHYSPAVAKRTFGRVRLASGIKNAGIERFQAEVSEWEQSISRLA